MYVDYLHWLVTVSVSSKRILKEISTKLDSRDHPQVESLKKDLFYDSRSAVSFKNLHERSAILAGLFGDLPHLIAEMHDDASKH